MSSTGTITRLLSRIGWGVLTFLVGGFYGLLGTIAHQLAVTFLGITVPWGLVLGNIAVLSLLIGLRQIMPNRLVVLIAALGVLGAVGLFSLKSFGGSVLVPDNPLGVAWTIAPTVLSMIVVVWPRLPGSDPA